MSKHIQLSNGGVALVDDDVFDLYGSMRWSKTLDGYVQGW